MHVSGPMKLSHSLQFRYIFWILSDWSRCPRRMLDLLDLLDLLKLSHSLRSVHDIYDCVAGRPSDLLVVIFCC